MIELPVSPRLLHDLQPHVPRPHAAAAFSGGPYHTQEQSQTVVEILRRHADGIIEAFVACGWHSDGMRVVHNGRTHSLVWPWEWTDAPTKTEWTEDGEAILPHGVLAIRLPQEWVNVAFESFVHTVGTVHVFMSRTPRPRHRGVVDVDDFVSGITDPERHRLFADVRRPGIVLHDRVAQDVPTRFACMAVVAAATKSGIVRFFAPDGDVQNLRGFVRTDPSILHGTVTSADARGICHVPPPSNFETDCEAMITGMTEPDVMEELGMRRSMPTPQHLRRFGVLPTATRHSWPYRLAFLWHLAKHMEVRYVEVAEEKMSETLVISNGTVCVGGRPNVAWDGRLWCVAK